MSSDLKALVDRQLADARARLADDAERIAASATHLAVDLRAGRHASAVLQLAHAAALLLHETSALDGQAQIAKLLDQA